MLKKSSYNAHKKGRSWCRFLLLFTAFFCSYTYNMSAALPARAENVVAQEESAPSASLLTLRDAWAMAYNNNPSLAAARAELRAADEQVSVALSGYRPTLAFDAEGGNSFTRVQGSVIYPKTVKEEPAQMGIELSQPIFNGFETPARVRGAEAAVMAQRATLAESEQQLLYDVAEVYFDIILAQKTLAFTRENERVLEKQLFITKDRRRVGELNKTDVSQAEARYKAAIVSRREAEKELANKRRTYARLVGEVPNGELVAPHLIAPEPEGEDALYIVAIKHNPSALKATYAYKAAEAGVDVSESALWPQISLVGRASRGWDQGISLPERQDSASIMIRARVPLYQAGEEYARIRAARQTSTQKRMEEDYIQKRVREVASNAWESFRTARESIKDREEVVAAAKEALIGVREESKVGTRTVLDVLNAEQELLDAKVNLARARHDEALAILQMESTQGTLTAKALRLDVKEYDAQKHYAEARASWFGVAANGE